MYGVVLWSDPSDRKAVIWCEDHGELAFFNDCAQSATDLVSLDAGDLVAFDMHTDRDMRYAHNPRVISEGAYPDLPAALSSNVAPARDDGERRSAEIIPFTVPRPAPMDAPRRSARG